MFVLELEFTDDPRRLEARPAHRERLVALNAAGTLVLAGPLAGDTGALLVFKASRADLDQILADDPYYSAPGVQISSVREWHPIVGVERDGEPDPSSQRTP